MDGTTGYNYPGWRSEITAGGAPSPSGDEGLWRTIEGIATGILTVAGTRAQQRIQGGTGIPAVAQPNHDGWIMAGVVGFVILIIILAMK